MRNGYLKRLQVTNRLIILISNIAFYLRILSHSVAYKENFMILYQGDRHRLLCHKFPVQVSQMMKIVHVIVKIYILCVHRNSMFA